MSEPLLKVLRDERAFEMVDGGGTAVRRSFLDSDEIRILDIIVTGWNTRVYFKMMVADRSYVPPSLMKEWTQVGKSYFFDLRNDTWGQVHETTKDISVLLHGRNRETA